MKPFSVIQIRGVIKKQTNSMGKFYEDLLNKCTTVLISPFSDIPMNLFEFYKKAASGLGTFQAVAVEKSLYWRDFQQSNLHEVGNGVLGRYCICRANEIIIMFV